MSGDSNQTTTQANKTEWPPARLALLLGAAACAIGALMPWIKVIGIISISRSGIDGSADGWLFVGLGVAALFLAAYPDRRYKWPLTIGGFVGFTAAMYDLQQIRSRVTGSSNEFGSLSVGSGMYLCIGGSAVLGLIGLTGDFWVTRPGAQSFNLRVKIDDDHQ